mmetsp:Transcript_166604/g.529461  ORF Transcript_166604/g.529461 Transcript_166604/m.529461 type:complete len:689 (+) Transcript_166604:91-2157(+)
MEPHTATRSPAAASAAAVRCILVAFGLALGSTWGPSKASADAFHLEARPRVAPDQVNATVTADSASPAAAAPRLHLVKLRRRGVRQQPQQLLAALGEDLGTSVAAGRAGPLEEIDDRGFFLGVISVGSPPQKFRVAFDTASGQIFLPSSSCTSGPCQEHFRYAPEASKAASDVNADGKPLRPPEGLGNDTVWHRDAISIGLSSLGVGDGQATGDLIKDELCLGGTSEKGQPGHTCMTLGLVAATEMTDLPFQSLPHDGIVGLGLSGLSVGKSFNLLERLAEGVAEGAEAALAPSFGLFFGEETGELALGGANAERLAGPLVWSPVDNPGEGYWQVRLRSVRLGNHTISACSQGQCRGLVDTCSTGIGVTAAILPELESALSKDGQKLCAGPDLVFELEGGHILLLRAEDYAHGGRAGGATACRAPNFLSMDLPESFAGVFVFGEPVLRRYYTAFNADPPSIGFGPLAVHAVPSSSAAAAGYASRGEDGLDIDREEAELEDATRVALASSGTSGQESPARSFVTFVVHACATQAMLVLIIFIVGSRARDERLPMALFAAQVSRTLARTGLISPNLASKVATRLSPEEAPSQGDECPICLGSCDDEQCGSKGPALHWCRLRCGHHFHEPCIFEWLWKSPRCPVCRAHVLHEVSAPTPEQRQQQQHQQQQQHESEEGSGAAAAHAEQPSSP